MPTIDYPASADELTLKERALYDSIMAKIPDAKLTLLRAAGGIPTDLNFTAPFDFTEDEFWRVGHGFTLLCWSWDPVGKKGDPKWGYVLHPL